MTSQVPPPPIGFSVPPGAGARFLVVGCGAIGGVLTTYLAESGQSVTAMTTNAGIYDAVSSRGLRLVGDGEPRRVNAPLVLGTPKDAEPFDYIVLATQPPQVEEATRGVAHLLAEKGAIVCLQNGLCEDRIAKIVGEDRVVGAVVGWGATMPEPGLYELTANGGFTLGRIDGGSLDAHDRLARAFEAVGPVETTQNLAGKRWSKLGINCVVSSLGTIGGDRLGALMPHRFVRRLALEVITEVVQVAQKERIRLEKVSGTLDLAWMSLDENEMKVTGSPSLVAKHGLLLAVGLRFRRMRSSMLSAIERGRPPAVDFLNGEVVERGKRHGVQTPVNEKVRDTVWQISRGEKKSGVDLLREVYEVTGPHGA